MDNQEVQNSVASNEQINSVDVKKKQNYKINNIIALIFVILVLIEIFWPVNTCKVCYEQNMQITDILTLPMIIFGVVAAASFLWRMVKITKGQKTSERVAGFIVGILGAVFIMIVGVFSSFIGGLRTHPT